MLTTHELTAAEARTVIHLWRLRHMLSSDSSAVSTRLLADILGISDEDVARMARAARRSLPSSLVASDARLSLLEAETVLAMHAASGGTGSEKLPLGAVAGALGVSENELAPMVRSAHERIAVAESITRVPAAIPPRMDAGGTMLRENPYSWQIMWSVVLMIVTLLGAVFLIAR
ncbi:MAG TPA: hypothetical protein VGE01_03360 [Fimbriimonas sp.]